MKILSDLEGFDNKDKTLVKENSNEVNQSQPSELILDFSSVNYIDTNGVKALKQSILDLKQRNVFVYICGAQGNK